MKHRYLAGIMLPSLLAWSAHFEAVQEKGEQALKQGQVKNAEALYRGFLKTAPLDEQAFAEMRLAIVYYKDQEHEKAFKTFLEALEKVKREDSYLMSEEERKIYEMALKIYLEDAGLTPKETAEKIAAQFDQVYEKNPRFHHLGYLLALGEANLGHYDRFFEKFYKSYVHDPENFLAYKTKAALHIKLFERAKTDEQRAEERQMILQNAREAVALQPKDTSLYRMILGFTPEEEKEAVLTTYLNKIMDQTIVIPRMDIPYYVEVAIAFKKYDLAQQFLNKARSWYAYSRVIEVAQQHLDEKKGSYGN